MLPALALLIYAFKVGHLSLSAPDSSLSFQEFSLSSQPSCLSWKFCIYLLFHLFFLPKSNKPSLFSGPIPVSNHKLAFVAFWTFSCRLHLKVFTIIFGEIMDLYDVGSYIIGPMECWKPII